MSRALWAMFSILSKDMYCNCVYGSLRADVFSYCYVMSIASLLW